MKRTRRGMIITAFATAVILGVSILLDGIRDTPHISVHETHDLIGNDSALLLLDVRTPPEWDGPLGHLDGAILMPVQELPDRLAELERYRQRRIVAYCRSGNRSRTATRLLRKHGFDAFNMEGGMLKWNAEGLPIENGESR